MNPFPADIEEVTTHWLSQSLSGVSGGANVSSFTTERIGEGVGLVGRLDRITLQWEGEVSTGPTTVIGKFADDNEGMRDIAKTFNLFGKEVNFYTSLASNSSVRTPACYAGHHDPESDNFVLLLEDLATGTMVDQIVGANQTQVEAVVEELVKLHASWWEHSAIARSDWILGFDHPLYTTAIPQTLDVLQPLASEILNLPNWYDRYRASVSHLITESAGRPWTLCHGDARLDNMFFDVGSDPVALLDWQVVLRASGLFDLAYFMSQSVPTDLRRSIDHDVVTHYRDRLVELGVKPPPFDELWHDYQLSTVGCVFYPLAGAGTTDPTDERAVSLLRTMLDRCVTASEDLDAISLLP